jgi:hypothetical protein
MEGICNLLEKNKWLLALMIIISNVGSGYLKDDIELQEANYKLNCFWVRKIVIFALVFCGTNDLRISLAATITYALLLWIF